MFLSGARFAVGTSPRTTRGGPPRPRGRALDVSPRRHSALAPRPPRGSDEALARRGHLP